jgi:RNA polymerase sigma-70 factor, ECF subfamily
MLRDHIHQEIGWFYPWLRRLTGRLMFRERHGHTLQPTALTNEVLLKLMAWQGELQAPDAEKGLKSLATTVARQTLVDSVRKHHHRRKYLEAQRAQPQAKAETQTRVRVAAALEKLAVSTPQVAELIRLRFFERYSLEESARLLGWSERTAARRWAFAKAYLASQLHEDMEAA